MLCFNLTAMHQAADYITEEKKQALLRELAELQGPKRKEILENLAYAKSLGDLAENAEYHQTREEQGKLEERISKIERILQLSQVAKKRGGDVVGIGSRVVVQKVPTESRGSTTPQKNGGGEKAKKKNLFFI